MPLAQWSTEQGRKVVNFGSQEVKGQGHMRSKITVIVVIVIIIMIIIADSEA